MPELIARFLLFWSCLLKLLPAWGSLARVGHCWVPAFFPGWGSVPPLAPSLKVPVKQNSVTISNLDLQKIPLRNHPLNRKHMVVQCALRNLMMMSQMIQI